MGTEVLYSKIFDTVVVERVIYLYLEQNESKNSHGKKYGAMLPKIICNGFIKKTLFYMK